MTAATRVETASPHPDIVGFSSPGGRSGQTSTVANAAWALAAAGRRVLVLDWATNRPSVPAHFPPRVARLEPDVALRAAIDLVHRPGSPPEVDRYVTPRQAGGGHVDVVTAGPDDQWMFSELVRNPVTGAELRSRLEATAYDHVLLDCPAQAPALTRAGLAHLCDVVVVCFRPAPQSVREATQMVGRLATEGPEELRLVAVATQIAHDQPEATRHVAAIHDAFARLDHPGAAGRAAPAVVEIPQHAYHEHLAILLDEGAVRDGLLRVVELIGGEPPVVLPVVDPGVLHWYRTDFADVSGEDSIGTVHLAYDAADRRWADWVRDALGRAGARTRDLSAAGDAAILTDADQVVVVGHRPLRDARVEALLCPLPDGGGTDPWPAGAAERPPVSVADDDAGPGPAGSGLAAGTDTSDPPCRPSVLQLQVDDGDYGVRAGNLYLVDLTDADEAGARGRLLTHLGMRLRSDGSTGRFRPRFPGTGAGVPAGPRVLDLPARVTGFGGREATLERLRDVLLADAEVPAALTGPISIGKAALAREFAVRFGGDYDVVWWIPAESRESAGQALRRLGEALRKEGLANGRAPARRGTAAEEDQRLGAREVVELLRKPAFGHPYLLVYDDVRDLDLLDDLVPAGPCGHVVLVARPGVLRPTDSEVVVGRLSPEEAVSLLHEFVPDLTVTHARAIADAVDHLPLPLRLAGAWLREQVDLVRRQAPADAAVTVAAMADLLRERIARPAGEVADRGGLWRLWEVVATTLDHIPIGGLTARLAELCVHLSGDRISLKLLRSSPMVAALVEAAGPDAAPLLADPIEFDRVLWTGVRFGIFDLTWGPHGLLRLSPPLQQVIGESMPDAERETRQRQVQLALARFAPGILEDEDQEHRVRLEELQHHLGPSGAVAATAVEVRRWVARQVRFMQLQQVASVARAALRIADEALARWRPTVPPDDPTLLWLEVERANILRAQGDYARARTVDETVRLQQSDSQGVDHLRTLVTTRGLAGDLRALGCYDEAEQYDSIAYHGFDRTLGGDHAHTLMAAHNLALSSYLDGDAHTAMLIQSDLLARRLRLLGDANPRTWWTAESLGTYQREFGDVDAALETLRQADGWVNRTLDGRRREHRVALRVARSLAVTQRAAGSPREAMASNTDLVRAFDRLLGQEHPDTWGCRMALAADHHVTGTPHEAVRIARDVLDRYRKSAAFGPDHPFTGLCQMNLALFLRGNRQLEEARDQGERAWHGLRATLSGPTHPWVLAAMVNQAAHLASVGDTRRARDLGGEAAQWCAEDLPAEHPYTLAAQRNLRLLDTSPADPSRFDGIAVDAPQM
ncbi:FxSxx-COOH system tetratricopeptide repeat protein [Micromonospora sp. NPDC048930]|uniref:FxSxx-COOH system tetratricopeptide repeat protein n=1 Tax=Micromonospora sp. NPDC048930 TaxID=3364261 RepID=UPI0037154859